MSSTKRAPAELPNKEQAANKKTKANDETAVPVHVVKYRPDGYSPITTYLCIKGCSEAIAFYKKAFHATEKMRFGDPTNKSEHGPVYHAELFFGDGLVMMSDEMLEMGYKSATTLNGTSVTNILYFEDVKKAFDEAVAAGAKPVMPPTEMFWGDLYGCVTDPYGFKWALATHKFDVPPTELQVRFNKLMASGFQSKEIFHENQTPAKSWHPEHYMPVTPYLIVRGVKAAIDFYKKAFDATEHYHIKGPEDSSNPGGINHTEMEIFGGRFLMNAENEKYQQLSPLSLKGSPNSLMIYVEDCDRVFNQAVAAGATVEKALADQPYGDRSGSVVDPFGHKWCISTHKEDVSDEEIKKRMSGCEGCPGGEKDGKDAKAAPAK